MTFPDNSPDSVLQTSPQRYIKASLLLLMIAIVYFLWTVLVIIGVYYLDLGYRWALLSMNEWIYGGWILLTIFIFMVVVFFARYVTQRKQAQPTDHPLYFKGKRVHSYTIPPGSEGGIFSKTHIKIDEDNILNVRIQIVNAEELWGSQ